MTTHWSQPIDLRPFFVAAEAFVAELSKRVQITSAVLDDWNAADGVHGGRIVYGGPVVDRCLGECQFCPLYLAVGEDSPDDDGSVKLRTTLCRARPEQLDFFKSKQPMLNCKSIGDYATAYADWTVEKCLTFEELLAEVNWIKGFRLLALNPGDSLQAQESFIKGAIIGNVMLRLGTRGHGKKERFNSLLSMLFPDQGAW